MAWATQCPALQFSNYNKQVLSFGLINNYIFGWSHHLDCDDSVTTNKSSVQADNDNQGYVFLFLPQDKTSQ